MILSFQNTYILLCVQSLCTHNTIAHAINLMLHADSITYVCAYCFTACSVNHTFPWYLLIIPQSLTQQEYLIIVILLMRNNIMHINHTYR
jgi:hypothetical protein